MRFVKKVFALVDKARIVAVFFPVAIHVEVLLRVIAFISTRNRDVILVVITPFVIGVFFREYGYPL